MNDEYYSDNRRSFMHFETTDICDSFIRHIGESLIQNRCCSGKGIAYNTEYHNRIQNARRNMFPEYTYPIGQRSISNVEPYRDYPIRQNHKELDKECCVCLVENRQYTVCSHNLCQKCNEKLVIRNCPICRKKI